MPLPPEFHCIIHVFVLPAAQEQVRADKHTHILTDKIKEKQVGIEFPNVWQLYQQTTFCLQFELKIKAY